MRRVFSGRRGRLVAALVVVLACAGGALAYFASTGSGSGSATVGSASPVTITAGVAPTQALFPGGSGDVTVHIVNPNGIPVHIGTLSLNTSEGTGSSGFDASPAGCNLGSLSFPTLATGWTVPASSFLDLDLLGSINMSVAATNACQGATFTVHLQAGP